MKWFCIISGAALIVLSIPQTGEESHFLVTLGTIWVLAGYIIDEIRKARP